MAQTALEASKALNRTFREHYDPEIFGVQESCTPVNDASRNLVYAMVADSEAGEVWLGKINRYQADEPLMRPYRGSVQLHPVTALTRDSEGPRLRAKGGEFIRSVGIVYNFGASFVVPCFDEALLMAMLAWNGNASSGAWDVIASRVEALGGYFLHWS